MKIDLSERSSKILEMLSEKLDYPPEYCLRIAIFEMARWMLGTPKEFLVFDKKDWDDTLTKAKKEVDDYWRKHPREAERKGIKIKQ